VGVQVQAEDAVDRKLAVGQGKEKGTCVTWVEETPVKQHARSCS